MFTDQTQIKSEISNPYEEVDQSNAEIDLSHVDIIQDNICFLLSEMEKIRSCETNMKNGNGKYVDI